MHNSLPRHIASFLGDKKSIVSIVVEHPKTATVNEISRVATKMLMEFIKPFYDSKNIDLSLDNVAWFIREPLKNSNFYSGSDQPIIFSIFLSEKGLVASYNDGGEYFKKQDVKYSWENRERHYEKNKTKIPGIGMSLGTRHIYHKADLIYVDSSEGTLYIGLGIDKIASK